MNTELRKRLEEAAATCARLRVYADPVYTNMKRSYIAGAEFGYGEAIEQAKEWIQKNVPIIHTEEGDYVRVNMGHKNVPMNKYLSDFEADMNKIWEE